MKDKFNLKFSVQLTKTSIVKKKPLNCSTLLPTQSYKGFNCFHFIYRPPHWLSLDYEYMLLSIQYFRL